MDPKYKSKLEELLDSELGDYSYFERWDIELQEGYTDNPDVEYYEADVFTYNDKRVNCLRFRLSKVENDDDPKIEIECGEDSWYEVEYFSWTIKYFWIALLEFK